MLKKIYFSETVRWIKLILCIHVYDISLYINFIFYSGRIRTLVVMAAYNPIDLKIDISAVSLEIFDFFHRYVCLLSSPPRSLRLLSILLNFIGWLDHKKRFSKTILHYENTPM